MRSSQRVSLAVATGALALAGPYLFPHWVTQLAFLWLMVLFALTWDVLGGQMGYNSFGNVLFFGLGCYATAVVQRDSGLTYFAALAAGMGLSALASTRSGTTRTRPSRWVCAPLATRSRPG